MQYKSINLLSKVYNFIVFKYTPHTLQIRTLQLNEMHFN